MARALWWVSRQTHQSDQEQHRSDASQLQGLGRGQAEDDAVLAVDVGNVPCCPHYRLPPRWTSWRLLSPTHSSAATGR